MKLEKFVADYAKFDNEEIISRTRINITVGLLISELSFQRNINFVFDTGATDITLPASVFGFDNETEFLQTHDTVKHMHSGIVSNCSIAYYRFIVNELKLGTIVLRDFPVWITFDNRVLVRLLGMSVIGLFKTEIDPLGCTLKLTETEELAHYTHNGLSIENPLDICKNEIIDFAVSELDAEANYINTKVKNSEG